MENKKKSYVGRAVFQKQAEEAKRMNREIRIIVYDLKHPDREAIIKKWQDKFKEEDEFNILMRNMAKGYLELHPEYKIFRNTEPHP